MRIARSCVISTANLVCRPVAVLLAVLATVPVSAQLLAPVQEPVASLERTTVPAAGRHRVVLTVQRFGRYAVTVSSEQGVSLQLVDRMAGPGPVSGIAGEQDGRIDCFLDYGEYLIIATGHELAEGEATLAVHPFAEVNPTPAPQLVELKPLDGELADLEQRSYWLQLDKRRVVAFEAAGRHLRDLRLWLDGSWLLDAAPETEVLEPRQGKPLLACRLVTQLEPGLYLLTAYGGASQAWAEDDGTQPYHLRFGIPTLGTAGRARFEVSPFGIDRWLVPNLANFYRLELPEQLPAELRVAQYNAGSPFSRGGTTATISKESRVPAAELTTSSSDNGYEIVTVSAEAGQPYVLQHFQSLWQYRFGGSGDYWISTIHSGHAEDSVDATSFLSHWTPRDGLEPLPLREQTITVSSDTGWATRCNLLDTLTVFLRIDDTGRYTIESESTEAEFLLEPFFVYRPSQYKAPPFEPAGHVWDLNEGYYVLSVRPKQKGILDMAIKPVGLLDSLLKKVGLGSEVEERPVRASSRFPSVPLQHRHSYEIFMNRQPEVHSGVILRKLPMSLSDPLPLTLSPGDEVSVPFTVSEPSRLQVVSEAGGLLDSSLDGGSWLQTHEVAAGTHTVSVRSRQEQTVVCSLGAVPLRLLHTAPLPPLPEGTLDMLPELEVLTTEQPRYFDLERSQHTTFLVSAAEDALYRLETTGLLDTEGNLRSRVVTSLARSSEGGSGRNLFLHQLLCAGDYQLTLNTRGSSRGHLGLELTRTDPLDGGELRIGLPARITLADGESVVYRFTIDEPGQYNLHSYALGHVPRCRLEDADGWPIIAPNVAASFSRRHFEAGSYRLVLLPEPVQGRRLTLLEKVIPPPQYEGHGPHRLPLAVAVDHRWYEPEQEGAERLPDVWLFELPGASQVEIELGSEMHGRLLRTDDDDGAATEVAHVPPLRGWQGRLDAGTYRLEVECVRVNNRVDYRLKVDPQALLPGLERSVQAPATVAVAVGESSLVEISSFGTDDVSARLLDSDGRIVAHNDDRDNDWNFHLAARLEPGEYALQVHPVAGTSAATRVAIEARHEVLGEPLELTPAAIRQLTPGADIHTFPLLLKVPAEGIESPPAEGIEAASTGVASAEMLLAAARSAETIGLAVEQQLPDGTWRSLALRVGSVGSIELPLADAGRYRLRVWSVDRRDNPVTVTASAVTPRHLDEQALTRGVSLQAVSTIDPPVAVAAVELAAPGTLRHRRSEHQVRWSPSADAALQPARDGILPAPGRLAWIAMELSGSSARLQAERLVLEPGADGLQLPLASQPPALLDLADTGERGPVLVVARSMVGQPAVQLVATGEPTAPDLQTVAIARNAAATVRLQAVGAAALAWLAEPASEQIDTRLQAIAFAGPTGREAGFGRHNGTLSGGAIELQLPPGDKQLRLVLTRGLVAAVCDDDKVHSVHFNGGDGLDELLVTSARRLLLLPLPEAADQDRYSIDVIPSGPAQVLAAGRPLELRSTVAGVLRVPVAAAPGEHGRSLFVRGSSSATLQTDSGQVLRGRRIELGAAGGTLLLHHPPGLLVAWIGTTESAELGLWHGIKTPRPIPVKTPQRLSLQGPVQVLALEPETPELLVLSSDQGAVFRLTTTDADRAWLGEQGGVHSAYLPAGRAELAVRAVAGATLSGSLKLVTTPVLEIGEGLGPEVLLAPGGTQAFRITVTEAGKIGVGVRADADTVECELLAGDGASLGHGVIQLHELAAGEYLLLIRLPADQAAVRARPAVVGLVRPSTGPPDKEIQRYLTMERGSR